MSFTEFEEMSVLVVDDEPMVREVVSAYLSRDGFSVTDVGNGRDALEHVEERPTDLIILDIMLPGTDGLAVLSQVRAESEIPVILLSARGEEADRVLGLELGADDYVVKPFSPRELVTRVRAVLRRASIPRHPGQRLTFDALTIDPELREVRISGRVVDLTPKEFDLLLFMASSPRQVFSRGQILDHVWNSGIDFQDPSTVTVHVRRLRQRIEDDPGSPSRLVTVWGVGYRFEP